jgi:hypothetical protein
MMFDWGAFLVRLQAYPAHFHRVLPPCPSERIEAVEKELGELPSTLTAMLRCFNGARLFLSAGPSFSLFGISTDPSPSPLEWTPDWWIDKYTPRWRTAGTNREVDWAIAMTNYGGLILLNDNETINEWDTGQSTWLSKDLPLEAWIENLISEGEVIMADVVPPKVSTLNGDKAVE